MDIIKGVTDKVASHKLAVTAAATGAVDITLPVAIVAAAYIHWSGVGRYVGRLRRGRGQREAGRL